MSLSVCTDKDAAHADLVVGKLLVPSEEYRWGEEAMTRQNNEALMEETMVVIVDSRVHFVVLRNKVSEKAGLVVSSAA